MKKKWNEATQQFGVWESLFGRRYTECLMLKRHFLTDSQRKYTTLETLFMEIWVLVVYMHVHASIQIQRNWETILAGEMLSSKSPLSLFQYTLLGARFFHRMRAKLVRAFQKKLRQMSSSRILLQRYYNDEFRVSF